MITVTPEAAARMQAMLQQQQWSDHGLRFGVRSGGCSGYSYQLEFEPEPHAGDVVHEEHGVRVFIALTDLPFVKGSVIGWKDELMETGFAIDNPNVKRACGCGSSFDL